MFRRQLSPAATVAVILLIPLALPVLFVFLGPSVDPVRAQEPGPKQPLVVPSRNAGTSTNSGTAGRRGVNARTGANRVTTVTPQKPSGKMEFVPDSPAPKSTRPIVPGRSAVNSVARRPMPDQSAKIAAVTPKPQAAPRVMAPSITTQPPALFEPVAEPARELIVEVDETPAPVATKELDLPVREPMEEPEVLVTTQSKPEPPKQFSEMPEPSLPDFELPIVHKESRPAPMLEVDEDEVIITQKEIPAARTGHNIVHLDFEETDTKEANESMELVEPERLVKEVPESVVESIVDSEIEHVAAQEKPNAAKVAAAVAQAVEVSGPSDDVMAELRLNPIHSIEIRKAVKVPPLGDMENPKLREPADQALAVLRKRPPYKFWPVYRDPWTASRDSFAFHHNPLWFEDPNLERCGRGFRNFSSMASVVHFSGNIAILPYRMTAEPAYSCVRTLPDCTVCQRYGCDAYLPPWSWRAAAVQAAAITGLIYAVP